jgi:putative transcription factor
MAIREALSSENADSLSPSSLSGIIALKCEICGGDTHSRGILIEVEGARLTVCDRCRRFGRETKPLRRPRDSPRDVASKTSPTIVRPSAKPRLVQEHSSKSELQEYELVEDYPQRIRRARESIKATQTELAKRIGERLSIIQKLETGKMWPSDLLVERIERTLHITLRTPISDDSIPHEREKTTSELTIGDIADTVVRKKES